MTEPTLEQRVERLEEILTKLVRVAQAHPLGRQLLKAIGL